MSHSVNYNQLLYAAVLICMFSIPVAIAEDGGGGIVGIPMKSDT